DKPTLISQAMPNSSAHSVKQKAAQVWNLVRFLPFMIGHKISRTKSLANRHQRLTCLYFNAAKGLGLVISTQCGPIEGVAYDSNLVELQNANTITIASWLEDNGMLYKPGGVVVLSMKTKPLFGLIKKTIVLHDVFYLLCEELLTEYFDHHFHSY
uniref:Uncharacterized protein n=1 Tax=Amphimedon queenslandica TaxID=400682 RepID=A0A1X7U522_AMPQE